MFGVELDLTPSNIHT